MDLFFQNFVTSERLRSKTKVLLVILKHTKILNLIVGEIDPIIFYNILLSFPMNFDCRNYFKNKICSILIIEVLLSGNVTIRDKNHQLSWWYFYRFFLHTSLKKLPWQRKRQSKKLKEKYHFHFLSAIHSKRVRAV